VTADPITVSDEDAEVSEDIILERLLDSIAPVGTQSKWTKVLLYGDLGVGKTVWAADSPAPLLVAIENGAKSLLNHESTRDVEVMEYRSVKQVEALAAKLQEGKLEKFDTIILDTFSELSRLVLDRHLEEQHRLYPDKSLYTPQGKDYQNNGEHMRRIAAAFRDVPRNVIFTSHEKEDKNEETGAVFLRPDLAPKVAKTLGGYVDLVGRMTSNMGEDADSFESEVRIRPTNRIMAKTRIKTLPTVLKNSTFMDVHKANLAQIASQE
jgi:phage nucleotide-binding protein